MSRTEFILEVREMFKGTVWRIDNVETVTNEEVIASLQSCVDSPISNQDIIIACDSLNFAQLYSRAKLREKAGKMLLEAESILNKTR